MSTPSNCRREEVALCQPDKKPAAAPECAIISEKQFLRDHTVYSAISSWLFAIAGATNIGVLCAFSSKVLTAAEQGKPLSAALSNKKYNRIALGMTGFGALCMGVSNWLESKKVVTEWQLGAGKLQRKTNIAEKERAQAEEKDAADAPQGRKWVAAVESEGSDRAGRRSGHILQILCIGVSCPIFALPAFAYDEPVAVPTIVVTPTRSPVPLNQIASSMTVIDREEIEKKNKPTVTELLEEVPGIAIANSGGVGQSTRIFMRGTNSNHVLVMMDGVAINDPSDPATAFDFSNLTTDNIERIEILRGPQSTLYGSQALGGVINIITRKGGGDARTTAFAEYGRYNSSKIGIDRLGEIGRTTYSFSASNSHTSGISAFDKQFGGQEKDGNNTYTFSGNAASRLTDNFTARIVARYNRSVSDFDSVGSLGIGGARPDDDPLPNGDSRYINARASGELSLMDGKWTQELGLSTLNVHRDMTAEFFDSVYAPHFERQQFIGTRNTVDWIHRLSMITNHLVTVGGEISSDSFEKNTDIEPLDTVNVDNRAVFVDDQFSSGPVFVNAGARVDDHQSFGTEFTWKIAPGYRIASTGTVLKASYGTGFKAPSLSQLFDPTSGNTLLGPEKSKGWDAGFEQALLEGKANFGATVFRNNITDLVGFGPAPLFATINIGKARAEGVEASLTLRPRLDWRIDSSYTYTLSEDRTHDTALLRRPKHLANVTSVYDYSASGDVRVNIRHVSSSRDWDWATSAFKVDVKAFTTVNIITNYRLDRGLTIYGRIDNLFDERYEEIDGFGQPGISLTVGAKANF